jgi:glycosyltransferase involved in cell wall biosynthesis
MHILHIETGRHLYGGALQVVYLLNGLKDKGVRNTLVCPKGSEIAAQSVNAARIHEVKFAGDMDISFLLRLWLIIISQRPDIVHVHSRRGADFWGGLAARIAKVPAVVTRRVDNPEKRPLVRLKYSLYNHVVTISEGIRSVLLSEGLRPGKTTLIHSAVDLNKYRYPGDLEWFHKEFGLNSGNKAIGTVAQFIPRKGHRNIIEAAPRILERCPEARFLFFGQGPLKDDIQALCKKSGLESFIRFPGFRKDLDRVLPCLDILLHPAVMEGLGVSLLQAAASEIPLIGSRAGGIPEIVEDGINGYLIPPDDREAIVRTVLSLLEDQEKRRRFGREGRRIVESSFSIDSMVDGYIRVYNDILEKIG